MSALVVYMNHLSECALPLPSFIYILSLLWWNLHGFFKPEQFLTLAGPCGKNGCPLTVAGQLWGQVSQQLQHLRFLLLLPQFKDITTFWSLELCAFH